MSKSLQVLDDTLKGHCRFAGSDTTAISLRAMFYFLCKHPRCYDRVIEEIDDTDRKRELSNPITFAEASRMKYLQACMKEAMRMHPAVGQLLERVVPQGGATIAGVWMPADTIVGINPWVVGRDRYVYGEDCDQYRPERWMEADPESAKAMERNYFAVSLPSGCEVIELTIVSKFGSGARTCLGKNVSLLEMSKLVPQLLRDYQIKLSNPEADWTLTDYWFVKQSNLFCRFKRRNK